MGKPSPQPTRDQPSSAAVEQGYPMPIRGADTQAPVTGMNPAYAPAVIGMLPGLSAGILEPQPRVGNPALTGKAPLVNMGSLEYAVFPNGERMVFFFFDVAIGGAFRSSSVAYEFLRRGFLGIIQDYHLPNGTQGNPYSMTLYTKGGVAPREFTVHDGALPDGLVLYAATGVIDGTPTVINTFGFTIRLQDSATAEGGQQTIYRLFQIEVTA